MDVLCKTSYASFKSRKRTPVQHQRLVNNQVKYITLQRAKAQWASKHYVNVKCQRFFFHVNLQQTNIRVAALQLIEILQRYIVLFCFGVLGVFFILNK